MKIVDVAFAAGSLLLGSLVAYSSERWIEASERGEREVHRAKEELLRTAGLFELHHRVYAEVGAAAWDGAVKPDFLSRITRAAAIDAGTLAPSPDEIVAWARANPGKAGRMMLEAAGK